MEEEQGLAGEGKARRWLAGLALGAVAMLALLPATGWMVREQIAYTAGALALRPATVETSFNLSSADEARLREVARRYPDDFPLQLAAAHRLVVARVERDRYAVSSDPLFRAKQEPGEMDGEYAELSARFGEKPSLHANLLRFATSGTVQTGRPEAARFLGKQPDPPRRADSLVNRPERLAAFLDHAVAGERLDPQNAYFPTMACIALFAMERDAEALEALRRAGMKTEWREYYQEECLGDWRLEERLGRQGALVRAGWAGLLLFPQYAQIRVVARVAGYLAMKAEQNGDPERGSLIRRDVMRVGSLMRLQGQSLITNLVGMGVVRIAMSRPGGAPPPPGPTNEEGEQKDTRVAREYDAYLTRIGHQEEAAWVRSEREAGSQVRSLLPTEVIGAGLEYPVYTTTSYWTGATMLLLNVVGWGVLGLAAAGLAASRWGRGGQPLPVALKRGMALGAALLGAVPALAALFNAAPTSEVLVWLVLAALVGAPALVLQWVYRSRGEQDVRLSLAGAAVTALLLPGMATLVTAQGLAAGVRLTLFESNPSVWKIPGLLWMVGGTLALPLLAAVIFAIAGRALRVPVGISLARGFRSAAGPVVCLLLLAYGGTVLATSRQEARLDYHLNRTLESEGRFLAEIAGKPWPGPTR